MTYGLVDSMCNGGMAKGMVGGGENVITWFIWHGVVRRGIGDYE